jgi:DNA-binding response OmpR family regulator
VEGRHILVVEDEINIRRSLVMILEQAGYRVEDYPDGKAALQRVHETENGRPKFDLLVTDVIMPGVSGLELIDQIRAEGYRLPVLIITGYRDEAMTWELYKRGCRAVIDKPFGLQELLQNVEFQLRDESDRRDENRAAEEYQPRTFNARQKSF